MRMIPFYTRENSTQTSTQGTSSPHSLTSRCSLVLSKCMTPHSTNPCCTFPPLCLCSHYSFHFKPSLLPSCLNNPQPLMFHTCTHTCKHTAHCCLLKSFSFSIQARFNSKVTSFINLSQSYSTTAAKMYLSCLCVGNDSLGACQASLPKTQGSSGEQGLAHWQIPSWAEYSAVSAGSVSAFFN